jgi:hypothetical protein
VGLDRKRDRIVDVVMKSSASNGLTFSDRLAAYGFFVLTGRCLDIPGCSGISLTTTMDVTERALPIFAKAHDRALTLS